MFKKLKRELKSRSHAEKLTIAVVTISIVQALLLNTGISALLFMPLRTVFNFEVWRPFTGLCIAASPLEVIFGGLIIYSIGGALEARVGKKRFITLALGIPLTAELLTIPVFLLFSSLPDVPYPGARNVVTSIWIAFGIIAHFSGQILQFWGTPVSGRTFALFGIGFVLLSGIFGSLVGVLPELLAAGLTYLYLFKPRSFDLKRRIELAYYNWKLRRLKAKKGFRVVQGSKDGESPDRHIH